MGDGPGIKGAPGGISPGTFQAMKVPSAIPCPTSKHLNTITSYDMILMFDGEPMTPVVRRLVLTLALAMRTSL